MKKLSNVFFLTLMIVTVLFPFSVLALQNGVVVYAYHRIDEPAFPSSNLNYSQFAEHVRELQQGDYNVIALPEAVQALTDETSLPPKTIVITFEGAHASIMDKAVPLLLESNLPFTLFVPTNQASWQGSEYVDWQDLKDLADNDLVTLGLHPAHYSSLLEKDDIAVQKEINRAKSKFRDEMGFVPDFFAYPFGEFSQTIEDIVKEHGFKGALGQQSGVAYSGSNLFRIPRFAMTESHGDLDRFLLTANAVPLPIQDITPENPVLSDNPPLIGFTLDDDQINPESLSCFATSEGRTDLTILDRRVEIRLQEPFPEGRARINCTAPAGYAEDGQQRWHWFGMLFSIPQTINDDTAVQ